jgi:hypothetical protein
MRRRIILLGMAVTAIIAGCAHSGGTAGSPQTRAAAVPSGTGPLVSWSLSGGNLAAGQQALRPPRLVVYATGVVVADATYRSDLPSTDVADLVSHLYGDLRTADAAKRRDGVAVPGDAPTTIFSVRTTHGAVSARAVALDELRQKSGYGTSLYDARDRIDALHQRVVSAGQPYTADRILLVAESDVNDASAPLPWPDSITLPTRAAPGDVHIEDLDGQGASAAVALMTRDLDLNGAWPAYRTSADTVVRASWRYLLPDE